ncbi:uncharacterized protein Ir87a [Eurosta solidaginis]|uniref:uncharacterized protein Ir87a n=1 Tax=Eurosta solidaginis TaxID=178769 RepID=UPI00353109FE
MLFLSLSPLVILLTSLSSVAFSHNLTHIKISDLNSSEIHCILALLKKYFQSGESLSGSVLAMILTPDTGNIQQDVLRAIYAQNDLPWTVALRQPYQDSHGREFSTILQEKPQCYFMVIENLEDVDMEVFYHDFENNVNCNNIAQFVVYLAMVEENEQYMNEIMMTTMLFFMNKKLYNINVIGRYKGAKYFYVKTVFPYHPDNNCGNRVIEMETLDICYYEMLQEGKTEGQGDGVEDEDICRDESEYRDGDRYRCYDDECNANGNGNEVVDVDGAGREHDNVEGDGKRGLKVDDDARIYEDEKGVDDGKVDGFDEQERVGNEVGDEVIHIDRGLEKKKTNSNTGGDADAESEEGSGNGSGKEGAGINSHRIMAKNKDQDVNSGENEKGNESRVENDISTKEVVKENYEKERKCSGNKDVDEDGERERDTKDGCRTGIKMDELTKVKYSKYKYNKLTKYRTQNKHINHTKKLHEPQPYRSSIDSTKPKIQLKELRRGLLVDKVPKDLSDCPIKAGYRSWEPYIFKEPAVEDLIPGTARAEDQTGITLSTTASSEESKNDIYEYTYSNKDDDESYANKDADYSAYNDVDSEAQPTAKPMSKYHGIEYQLIQTIGERLNIKINLQVESDNIFLLFHQLMAGDVEMIIGGIDEDPSISPYISTTIPYNQDDLTWCVAKAKRNYQLFNMFNNFHINTWILTLALMLIVTLHVSVTQKLLRLRLRQFRGIFVTFSRVYGILLSQSAYIRHLPMSLRLTFIFTFIFSLMFVNLYQSFLVSTLTTPVASYQVSHLEEIYRNRMTVTGSVDNVRHIDKDGEIFEYIRQNFKMCYNIEECLNRAATDESVAVAVSRQHSFYNPRIRRDHLYCFDRNENLYIYLVTILVPKKFHLLHKINAVIENVIESGHMEKWARELDMKRKIRDSIRQAQMVSVKGLTINQVVGTFVLHAMILAVALIIFLLECWAHWMVVKRRTRLRLVKMLHRRFNEM